MLSFFKFKYSLDITQEDTLKNLLDCTIIQNYIRKYPRCSWWNIDGYGGSTFREALITKLYWEYKKLI